MMLPVQVPVSEDWARPERMKKMMKADNNSARDIEMILNGEGSESEYTGMERVDPVQDMERRSAENVPAVPERCRGVSGR